MMHELQQIILEPRRECLGKAVQVDQEARQAHTTYASHNGEKRYTLHSLLGMRVEDYIGDRAY